MKKTLLGLVAGLLASHIFAGLPDGYTQLEWIMVDDGSSACNTWIDSGVKGRSGLIVNADIRLRSNVGQPGIFGAYSGDARLALLRGWGQPWFDLVHYYGSSYKGSPSCQIFTSDSDGKVYQNKIDSRYDVFERSVFTMSNGVVHINGVRIVDANGSSTESFEMNENILFLKVQNYEPLRPTAALVWGFNIKDASSGEYICNLVPACRDSDGCVGMYDIVNNIFRGSAGAGKFVAGPRTSSVYAVNEQVSHIYRSEMTVSGYEGSESLKRFPVLVRVSPSLIANFSYEKCLSDGSDVFFALDEDGKNRLACDIESWDPDGTSLVWVKLPELAGNDTKFYMFFGGNKAAERPASTEVWSEYAAVWHMNGYDPETGVSDVAGNALFNATNLPGGVSTPTDSPFGGTGALHMTKGLQAINLDQIWVIGGDFHRNPVTTTVSCWFKKPDGGADGDAIMSNLEVSTTSKEYGYKLRLSGDNCNKVDFYANSGGPVAEGALVGDKEVDFKENWAHLSFVTTPRRIYSYLDGVPAGDRDTGSLDTFPATTKACGRTVKTVPIVFGGGETPLCMDEVRISRLPRSVTWLKAEYDSMNDMEFVAAGAAGRINVLVEPSEGIDYGAGEMFYGADIVEEASKTYTAIENIAVGDTIRAHCSGWKLYEIDSETGAETLVRDSAAALEGESATTCIVTPGDSLYRLVWQWASQWKLTALANDSSFGSLTVSEGDGWYDSDAEVTVTAVASEGYAFSHWEGDVDAVSDVNASSTTITMTNPVSLTAVFAFCKAQILTDGENAYYKTFGDAFAAAKDGDVITLRESADYSGALDVSGKSVTIDAGANTLAVDGGVTVGSEKTLTIKGGVFPGLSLIANGGTVTIEGGTFTDGAFEAVALPDAESKVTSVIGISGGSFVSSSFKSYMNANGKAGASSTRIDINGGEFEDCKAASGYMGDAKITDEGNRFSHKIAKHVSVAGGVRSEYDTLFDAIEAAADGVETAITLQCGVIVPQGERIKITNGKVIKLNGGDYEVFCHFSTSSCNVGVDGRFVIESGIYHNVCSVMGAGRSGSELGSSRQHVGACLVVNGGVFNEFDVLSYGFPGRNATADDPTPSRLEIYGGQFNGYFSIRSYLRCCAYIYGGSYQEKPSVAANYYKIQYSYIYLRGGVFFNGIDCSTTSSDEAATLPSGYTLSAITDTSSGSSQTYYVPTKSQVALNWNTARIYDTIADAVADAKSGEEIRYFADIADTSEVVVPRGKTVTLVATGAYTLANSFTVGGKLILKNAGFTGEFVLSGAGEIVTHFDPNAEESKVNLKGSKFRDNRDGTWSATQGFAIIIL